MTTKEIVNRPVKLAIDGVDAAGAPAAMELLIERSLPADVALALDEDLVAIGRRGRQPYELVKPQLDWLAAEAKKAAQRKDHDAAGQFQADRNRMIDRLHDSILSKTADEITADGYWLEGRKSVDGLVHEIAERVKLAGGTMTEAELRVVITTGNAGIVYSRLRDALEDKADPSAAT